MLKELGEEKLLQVASCQELDSQHFWLPYSINFRQPRSTTQLTLIFSKSRRFPSIWNGTT